MNMGSMDSSYSAMTPASSGYGGNYGSSTMGGPPGGFSAQSFAPPSNYVPASSYAPSTYALPAGLTAPSPYMPGGYSQMGSNGMPQQGGFDSRAEQAFNQGNASATGGASSYSNGGYGGNAGYTPYGNDGSESFSFLNTGMNNLGLGDRDDRRNGQGNVKSPQ